MERGWRESFIRMARHLKKIQWRIHNGARIVALLVCCYILSYEVPSVRKVLLSFMRGVRHFLLRYQIPVWGKDTVRELYFGGQRTCLLFLLCYLVIGLVLFCLFEAADRVVSKMIPEDSSFETSLMKYLRDKEKNSNRCYLLTGMWGSGKTYSMNRFLEQYFLFSRRKVYRISCFGLDTREELLKEINSMIEREDNNGYSSFLQILQYVPIVGDPLSEFLKKSYTIRNVKTGSLFVFDDFERVTARGQRTPYYVKRPYENRSIGTTQSREAQNIEREFKKIENGFQAIAKEESQLVDSLYLEKYNAIVGFINELIENYRMKVVVICNADILGHAYLNTIFRGKLNCLEYYKRADRYSVYSVAAEALSNWIPESRRVKTHVEEFWRREKTFFERVWSRYDNSNLRFVDTFFHAFLDTAAVLKDEDMYSSSDMCLESLFYSMFTVHCLYEERALSDMNRIPTGGNLYFFLKLYRKPETIWGMLEEKRDRVRWVDIRLSGAWIRNRPYYRSSINMQDTFSAYPYQPLESQLAEGGGNVNLTGTNYGLEHLFYLERFEIGGAGSLWEVYIKEDIISEDIDKDAKEQVKEILRTAELVFHGRFSEKFLTALFKVLYNKFYVTTIESSEGSFMIRRYNEYVKTQA